ncbi:MAG: hypothetical protein AB1546_03055 [bacterium]
MTPVEIIKDGDEVLGIIIRCDYEEKGLKFFTMPEYNLQLGIHNRAGGTFIPPHKHLPIKELKDVPIQEFFYLVKGRVKVDFFNSEEKFVASRELGAGDMILIIGAHAFTFLEEVKLIEIKQGPYRGVEEDKREIGEKL